MKTKQTPQEYKNKKPQLYQTNISNEMKRKITIVIKGGCVTDVVKENLEDLTIIVHDYDVDQTDPNLLKKDNDGEKYQVVTLE
mgnify:FL=1|jgi:hypothetical protein